MKTFYITIGVLTLAFLGFAQSTAPASAPADGRASNSHIHPFALDPSPTETPVTGTKSRALDRIGFEVKDLEDFTQTLEANGLKLDTPPLG
jgi:hypothetical protein